MKLSEVATENDRESTVDFITKTWSKIIHQEETVQLSAKIKQHTNSHRWKDYNGRKVWTVNATDVEYITVELIDNPEEINRIKREIEATKHDNMIDKKKKQQKLKELNQRLTSKTKQRQFQIKPEKRQSQ